MAEQVMTEQDKEVKTLMAVLDGMIAQCDWELKRLKTLNITSAGLAVLNLTLAVFWALRLAGVI